MNTVETHPMNNQGFIDDYDLHELYDAGIMDFLGPEGVDADYELVSPPVKQWKFSQAPDPAPKRFQVVCPTCGAQPGKPCLGPRAGHAPRRLVQFAQDQLRSPDADL